MEKTRKERDIWIKARNIWLYKHIRHYQCKVATGEDKYQYIENLFDEKIKIDGKYDDIKHTFVLSPRNGEDLDICWNKIRRFNELSAKGDKELEGGYLDTFYTHLIIRGGHLTHGMHPFALVCHYNRDNLQRVRNFFLSSCIDLWDYDNETMILMPDGCSLPGRSYSYSNVIPPVKPRIA